MFPHIEDWTSPMDELRNRSDIHNLSMEEWAWFHPSSYKLIQLGTFPVLACTWSLTIIIISLLGLNKALLIMPGVGLGYSIFKGVQKFNERENLEDITFYDMYLREYK